MQKEYFSNNFNKNTIDLIKKDGLDNLYFICDFDNTINHLFTIDGRKVPGLISFLEREEFDFPQDGIIEMRDLFLKYYPIEIDPNIDNESKKSIMRDWWISVFKVLGRYGLNKEQIINISKHIDIRIRQGFFDLLKFLNEQNIPVIVFSASSVGKNCIELVLEKNKIFFKNMTVICNELNFNEYGNYTGYQEPLIYSFNKSGGIIKEYFQEIYQKIQNKKNVVLIGDSLGDHHMLDGLSFENSLKIGFLNHNEDENLQKYLAKYDIVLTGDHDFSNWERMI